MLRLRVGVKKASETVGRCSGDATDECGLDGAAEPTGSDEHTFDSTEDGEGEQGDCDRELECFGGVGDKDVGEQRNEAAHDVGDGDGEGGTMGAVGGGFFKAEFEAHHEVDPGGGVLLEGIEDGCGSGTINVVLLEDLIDLFFFVAGAFDDLSLFPLALGVVVFDISAGGEVATETHGDGAGGDLG